MTRFTGCALSPDVDVEAVRRLSEDPDQRLRQLEVDGLVTRAYHAEMPPRVEYAGTPLADTLEPVLTALRVW